MIQSKRILITFVYTCKIIAWFNAYFYGYKSENNDSPVYSKNIHFSASFSTCLS